MMGMTLDLKAIACLAGYISLLCLLKDQVATALFSESQAMDIKVKGLCSLAIQFKYAEIDV